MYLQCTHNVSVLYFSHVDAAWHDIRCVATDNGSCFDATFRAVLPGVPRILCVHHINENIKSHLMGQLGSTDRWTAFKRSWWRLVLDMVDETEFEREWCQLMAAYPESRSYLTQWVYPDRRLWCRVWTRQYVTFGALTTQRSESANSALKRFLKSNATLETLFRTILKIVQSWTTSRDDSIERNQHTNHRTAGPVYTAAVEHLTREAAALVYTESQYMTEYHCHLFRRPPLGCTPSVYSSETRSSRAHFVPHQYLSGLHTELIQSSENTSSVFMSSSSSTDQVPTQSSVMSTDLYHPHACADLPDDGWLYCVRHRVTGQAHVTHWVRVREGSASCTDCKFSTNFLLPCRHILATNVMRWPTANAFHLGQCHRRWWLEKDSHPAALPSATSVLLPIPTPITLTDALEIADDSGRELSKDDIYRKWTAAATAVCGFIQPHGEGGLLYALSVLDDITARLAKGGKGLPRNHKVSLHTVFLQYFHSTLKDFTYSSQCTQTDFNTVLFCRSEAANRYKQETACQ